MNFGEKLKKARMDKGITQKDFAEKIGLSKDLYNKYENNKNRPSFETIMNICKELNLSADYLLGINDGLTKLNNKPLTNSQRTTKLQEILSKIELDIEEDEALETIINFINSNKEILEKSINYTDKENNI